MATVSSFRVVFKGISFLLSDSEVMNVMVLKKKKNLIIHQKVKIIQEVEKNPTMSQYEIANMSCAASIVIK